MLNWMSIYTTGCTIKMPKGETHSINFINKYRTTFYPLKPRKYVCMMFLLFLLRIRDVTPTFCIIKFYQARSALDCILEEFCLKKSFSQINLA
jgi:hypothetical protein